MNELDKTSSEEKNVTPESPTACQAAEETVAIEKEVDKEALEVAETPECDGENPCIEEVSSEMDAAGLTDEEAIGDNRKLFSGMTKEELVEALRNILAENRLDAYREVNSIRKAFSTIREKEAEAELSEFIDAGNSPEEFSSTPSESDEEFSRMAAEFRSRRTEYLAAEEARKISNLEKKCDIVKRILDLTEDIDNINMRFPEFKQLQVDFKEIKDIPQSEESGVWKNFQAAVEQFYDVLKVNKELRDLDFKKNLDQKRQLIDEVKKLETEADVVSALRKLQDLRDQWREIGPVAKELRDEIWKEFNASATIVFRRHQEFFETRKAAEQEAEEAKTALCVEAEAIAAREMSRNSDWEAAANDMKELQEKWKNAGHASRKANNALFTRFRAACDDLFNRRNEHFRQQRERFDQAIKAKEALIAKVAALAEEEDLSKAVAETIKIQEDWKHAGMVPAKLKDAMWKRFREACDVIFDRRKKETGEQRKEQAANLEAKRQLIARLKEIPMDLDRKEGIARVRELQDEWSSIGFVPFKNKNSIQQEYREACDALYDNFKMKEQRARMRNFSERLDATEGSKLGRERERLMRDLDRKRQELQTYRNNLGFLSAKSSSGNSMVKEMERRTKLIEEEIDTIRKKIEMVEEKIN